MRGWKGNYQGCYKNIFQPNFPRKINLGVTQTGSKIGFEKKSSQNQTKFTPKLYSFFETDGFGWLVSKPSMVSVTPVYIFIFFKLRTFLMFS